MYLVASQNKGTPNIEPKILYSLLLGPQHGTPNFGKPHLGGPGRVSGTLAKRGDLEEGTKKVYEAVAPVHDVLP